jgi:hypothetical protein
MNGKVGKISDWEREWQVPNQRKITFGTQM